MSLYMMQFAYTPEAWKAFAINPESRSSVFRELVERLGGRLLSFYYSFGEYDGVVIFEVPDKVTPTTATIISPLPRWAA